MLDSQCSKTCGYKAAGTLEECGVSHGNLLYETDPSVNNKVNTCYSMKTVAVPKVPRNTVWLAHSHLRKGRECSPVFELGSNCPRDCVCCHLQTNAIPFKQCAGSA